MNPDHFPAWKPLGAQAERVRKFDEPVRIFVTSKGAPDRRAEIAAIIGDIRAHVKHLDVALTNDREAANFFVTLLSEHDLGGTIRARYGNGKAARIQQSLNPQCLSGIGKDKRYRIRRAEVILPVDAGDFTFYDCAYEELLQALVNQTRDLAQLIESPANRGWRPELQGWRNVLLPEFAAGAEAATWSQDPAQRQRAAFSVHKLSEFARVARLVSVMNVSMRRHYTSPLRG